MTRAPFDICDLPGAMSPRGADGASMRVPQPITPAGSRTGAGARRRSPGARASVPDGEVVAGPVDTADQPQGAPREVDDRGPVAGHRWHRAVEVRRGRHVADGQPRPSPGRVVRARAVN